MTPTTTGRLSPCSSSSARHRFDITYRALVMGILNRTPDSFFDQGAYFDFDDFLAQGRAAGGRGRRLPRRRRGEGRARPRGRRARRSSSGSSRPSRRCAARFDVPLSVDTWRARSCSTPRFAAGAVVGNDISGLRRPRLPAGVRRGTRRRVVATHIRLGPRVPDPEPHYDDVRGRRARVPRRPGRRSRGRRHPPRADHGRRRARPRQDRAAVARAAPRRPTSWSPSATRCSCRRRTSGSSASCSASSVDDRRDGDHRRPRARRRARVPGPAGPRRAGARRRVADVGGGGPRGRSGRARAGDVEPRAGRTS